MKTITKPKKIDTGVYSYRDYRIKKGKNICGGYWDIIKDNEITTRFYLLRDCMTWIDYDHIRSANNQLKTLLRTYREFIQNEVKLVGSPDALSQQTGIAESTINAVLSRNETMPIIRLARKLEKTKRHKKNAVKNISTRDSTGFCEPEEK